MNDTHIPVIAIVGRPNVGKSTLFNALTKTRDALVANQPGLTRDRRFGVGKVGPCRYMLVDTGGLHDEDSGVMETLITDQALQAVEEADVVFFMVDGRAGLSSLDSTIGERLRGFSTPIHVLVNKTEGLNRDTVNSEFFALGLGECHAIAAAHKQGINHLMDEVLEPYSHQEQGPEVEESSGIKVAIVGRPNVGKSTLVNRMLGEDRQVTFDFPGTTRDSIEIPFERDGEQYTLIDTAGVRRRSKVNETVEKFSVIKALQAMEHSHVVIMLFDATEGATDQDASLLGYALDSGRALVLAINKWDGLSPERRERVRHSLERKLHFIDFCKPRFISALHGSGVGNLFDAVQKAWKSANIEISTSYFNRVLANIVEAHPPPQIHGHRIKLRYGHQAGKNPPRFVVHGNQVDRLPDSYKRYLSNSLREGFKLQGTPVQFIFKQTENPFKERRQKLTPLQEYKRKRLIKNVKNVKGVKRIKKVKKVKKK